MRLHILVIIFSFIIIDSAFADYTAMSECKKPLRKKGKYITISISTYGIKSLSNCNLIGKTKARNMNKEGYKCKGEEHSDTHFCSDDTSNFFLNGLKNMKAHKQLMTSYVSFNDFSGYFSSINFWTRPFEKYLCDTYEKNLKKHNVKNVKCVPSKNGYKDEMSLSRSRKR